MIKPKTCQYLSIFATVVLISSMVSLYFLQALFSASVVIIFLQVCAAGLMLWARVSFGKRSFYFAAQPTSEVLITHGAYQWLRHPIYAAIWLFSWAGIAAHLNVINVILALVVLASLLARMRCEELCLRLQFADYSAYAQRTTCLIPFVW